jgi:hypothetical protein
MKDKITTFLFLIVIFGFSIFHILLTDNEISNTERRKLSTFPEFTLTSEYSEKIDKYLLDHFPLRDTFRSIKANFNYKILHKLDNNDIYFKDNYIFKSEYPTNKKNIADFINKTNKLKNLFSEKNNTYIMIIPDKNYYLDDKNFLQIDYDYIYQEIDKLDMKKIDIRDLMILDDYYETDTHWKQERLDKVVKEMSNSMNFKYKNITYKENTYDKFYGVYYGESAISRKPEMITYLTNDTILNSKVEYLENKNLTTVYNLDNLKSLDSYEVYLDGASSLIEITNTNSKSKKELIIFRDSFGSSLSPLLIEYYDKITIVDNRYISSDYIKEYIKFADQDILFMYSTLIVNNSVTLKG